MEGQRREDGWENKEGRLGRLKERRKGRMLRREEVKR